MDQRFFLISQKKTEWVFSKTHIPLADLECMYLPFLASVAYLQTHFQEQVHVVCGVKKVLLPQNGLYLWIFG